MTLNVETPRVLFVGSGTRGPFTLSVGGTPITFADDDDLVVRRFDEDGVATTLTRVTDYTLSATSVATGDSAASLTLTSGQAVLASSTEHLLVERDTPKRQPVNLIQTGTFSKTDNEGLYDALWRAIQELDAKVSRALRLNPLDSGITMELPAAEAGKVISWNSDADGFSNSTLPQWLSGSSVPTSSDGADGDMYLRSNGDVYGPRASSSWGSSVLNLVGATGAAGTTWYSGSGAPGGGTGSNGDYYLRTSNGDVYTKSGGSWSVVMNIIGPAGSGAGDMLKTENLSGLADYATARSNLGLGSAALLASSAVFQVANNLSEGNASTMRSNLGLGTAAVLASSAVAQTANNLADLASASTARSNLGLVIMTTAQFWANTASKVVTTDQLWAAGAFVTLSDGANIAVDMGVGVNFSVTLGGNRTLSNPSNPKVGQSGVIRVTQDGTGSRTLAYDTQYKFVGGAAPTLSTAAGTVDYLFYFVETASRIYISAAKGIA